MRQQFLYGRKNAGYCQLNHDDYIVSGDDLLRLATLQNYIPADGMNLDDLPLEYYAYTDEIDGARVWIEGLTSFVPGGTSVESGSRDTSMVHKYIYSGEDFNRHIGAEEEAETERKTRRFYCTVEDYRQGTGKNIEPDEGSEIKFSDLEKEFGFDGDDGGEKLADFIVCCLDAFSKPERRVYCYLPSADRKGSLCAKSLMETLLKVLPSCVNTGAGFITYSQNFHNASTNPIPGNISVIFIPDTINNRQWEVSERNKSYIFDFKDYEKQNKLECYEHIKSFVDALINDMRIGRKDKTILYYNGLMFFVKYDAVIDADFLSSFYLFLKLRNHVINAGDKKETYYGNIGDTIGELLESEEFLTKEGKDRISQDVKYLLEHCQYTETDLEWIDNIYKSGELCRNQILYHLCDACLQFAKEPSHDQNEEILTITNFDYSDADLNDSILSIIYSNDKYFLVGQRLISETLTPLKRNSKKTASEKRALLLSSVNGQYKVYPDFVTSPYFTEEISVFLADCIQSIDNTDDMQAEMTAVREVFEKMDRDFQEAYNPVLRELAYLVVQKFIMSLRSSYEPAPEAELTYCEDLARQYALNEFEKEKKQRSCYVEKLEKAIRENLCQRALDSGYVKEVLEVFGKYPEDAGVVCKYNISKVQKYLEACPRECEYRDDLRDWKELLLCFCCMIDRKDKQLWELWGQCLDFVVKKENLRGGIEFHHGMEEKIIEQAKGREVEEHPVLQEFAYLIVKKLVTDVQSQKSSVGESALQDCEDLVSRYNLDNYEQRKYPGKSYVSNLEEITLKNRLQQALVSGKVKEVLAGFRKLTFEYAVEFCKENIYDVNACLRKCKSDISWAGGNSWKSGRDSFNRETQVRDFEQYDVQYTFEDWKKLFLYFCCMENSDNVMEECLSFVMEKEGSSGVGRFYQDLKNKRMCKGISENDRKKLEKKEKLILQKVINQDKDFGKEKIPSKSKGLFLKFGGKIPKEDKQENDELEDFYG